MTTRDRPRLQQVAFRCDWEDCGRLALGYYPARIAVRQKLSPYRFCRPSHQQRHWRRRRREKRLATMTPRLCPLCGKEIPPELRRGRPRRYCSTEHADAAANRRRPRVPALDLEEEVRKAELADQEAWAAAEAAAESATAASQEAAAAVQRAQSRWKGQETVDSALGLVEGLKATREQITAAEPAGARTAESESLRDDYREQYGRVKASPLALLVYQEWITGRFLVEVQAAAQAKTADAERARETLNNDKRRRDRRAAAARRRRAEGPKPLPQNAAGRVVYPAWHARAGQEIREG